MLATRMVAFAAAMSLTAATGALAQVRVAQWNITNWGTTSVAARGAAFQTSFYGVVPSGPVAGQKFAPDIIIAEEIQQGGAPTSLPVPSSYQTTGQANVIAFLNLLNNTANNPAIVSPGDWAAAEYVANQGDTGNALFYRTSKVSLVPYSTSPYLSALTLGTLNVDVAQIPTGPPWYSPRDNQRWRVRLIGYGANPENELYLYGGHFKASDGSTEQSRKIPESQRIRNDAAALPAGANFILGADLNVQTSTRNYYQILVGAGTGQFFDPINSTGTWNGNSTFRYIHTQEPGSTMDDRHDQLLLSGSLFSHQGFSYIFTGTTISGSNPFGIPTFSTTTWNDPRHTYRCWGNDGAHFLGAINSGSTNAQVGQAIADALVTTVTAGGGHLAVYLDLQVPAKLGAPTGTIDLGTVAQNSSVSYSLPISNVADLARYSKDLTGYGIDGLSYSLAITSSSFTIPAGPGPFEAPATNPGTTNSHAVTLDTSTPGSKSATITITSDDPDNPTRVVMLTANVQAATPTGACCTPSSGACVIRLMTACVLPDQWNGAASCTLPGNPCPQPTGACCTPSSGTCALDLQAACATPRVWSGEASCTSPNPCPQPTGACCTPSSGTCALDLQAACATPRVWSGEASCTSPNPCPQPTGACCTPSSGACALDLQAACATPRVWSGETSCTSPNPCPQPTGACCFNTNCSITTQAACVPGSFQGVATTCGVLGNPVTCCPANYNQTDGITTQDIFDFLNAWFAGNLSTDFDHSGQLQVSDIFSFLNAWFAGCAP